MITDATLLNDLSKVEYRPLNNNIIVLAPKHDGKIELSKDQRADMLKGKRLDMIVASTDSTNELGLLPGDEVLVLGQFLMPIPGDSPVTGYDLFYVSQHHIQLVRK